MSKSIVELKSAIVQEENRRLYSPDDMVELTNEQELLVTATDGSWPQPGEYLRPSNLDGPIEPAPVAQGSDIIAALRGAVGQVAILHCEPFALSQLVGQFCRSGGFRTEGSLPVAASAWFTVGNNGLIYLTQQLPSRPDRDHQEQSDQIGGLPDITGWVDERVRGMRSSVTCPIICVIDTPAGFRELLDLDDLSRLARETKAVVVIPEWTDDFESTRLEIVRREAARQASSWTCAVPRSDITSPFPTGFVLV
jgi:hypothetical protein